MADELVLTAETGRALGSRASRRIRRDNKVPGVLYGLDMPPVSFALDYSELRRVLTTDAGLNALIQIDVGGERQLSILKDIQRHPVRDEVLHIDFIRIDPNEELQVDVPLILEGDARKVTDESGMVDQTMFSLSVFASPRSIPNEIFVDISGLEINDSVRVSDLPLPSGVRTEVDPDEAVAVASVTRSTLESMAAEEAAEEAAEAEEAAGEGEEPAEAEEEAGEE
jgi:large subunit ribosomal protein L25